MTRTGGFNPDYYAPLFDAEDRHFWFRARNAVLEGIVTAETASLADGFRVLEVGCGTGYVLRMLNQVCRRGIVVGMDLFDDGLRMAKQRSGAALVRATVEQPPFREPFDIVGIFDTLEHIEDDRRVLANLRDLVRPRGALLITVPAYQELWSDFDEEARHCRRYSPELLHERLVSAGFDVEYLTPFMASLYPLARVGRVIGDWWRHRERSAGRHDGSAVVEQLKIRPGFNGLMSFVLSQEARLVAARKHLPVGTSLLALARVA